MIRALQVIDSHTAGEPTRLVTGGDLPDFSGLEAAEVRTRLEGDWQWIRSAVLAEPRGFEAMVGALLCDSGRADCEAGVVFFNNAGVLNGCVHGTIGVAESLWHLGRIREGVHGIETPVGRVEVRREPGGEFAVENVRSFRWKQGVSVEVPGRGPVVGDIAWGGNWFFLVDAPEGLRIEKSELAVLTEFGIGVRQALEAGGIRGEDGGEIDHIEVFGPPGDPALADSRNFVLCPGLEYDRSPCGTGTSAKLASLYADGKLAEGEVWRQAGILDTVFEGSVTAAAEGGVVPTVRGRAWITGEAELRFAEDDPFRLGIPWHDNVPSELD